MSKWFIAAKKADFSEIGKQFGISPVLARLIRNRDIIGEEEIRKYLFGGIEEMYDPFLLKGMDEAVKILTGKIKANASIRVIGDYDVDGICGAYILAKGIKELGGKVDVVIPHRIKDGYGLNESLISEAYEAGVDTIVTCDNGIAANGPISMAKELKMTVIITDHHEVPPQFLADIPEEMPPADVIVDPKQEGCGYPYQDICGGMVALKVIEGLFSYFSKCNADESNNGLNGSLNFGISERLQMEFRCLAAIATVCDVMALYDENRILVKYGLKYFKACGNFGLQALAEVNGIDANKLSAYHLGFIIGPCLNATGRLDTAERALTLLNAENYREAMNIAAELKNLNESRKEMTARGVEEAIAVATEMFHNDKDIFHKVLVLYLPECHESLAGIIAGRVRERFHRPAFILTDGEDEVKGSGRSIPAYHMYDELYKCKELFMKFGGHKQAAGLSIKAENVEEFRRIVNENANLCEDDFIPKINIDIALPLSYISSELIREFELLEPFGVGNTKPVFARKDVSLLKGQVMGKAGRAAKYQIDDEGRRYEILHFGDITAFDQFLCEKYSVEQKDGLYSFHKNDKVVPMKISITYYPDMVTYKGQADIRIVMQDYC